MRKPAGMQLETWVDRQIREATERGAFDDLPLAGKPLPDRSADGADWWLKDLLRREGVSGEGALPPALQLRKEIERLPDTVRDIDSEVEVRRVVEKLNTRVQDCWRSINGPQFTVLMVNVDEIVAEWRAGRETPAAAPAPRPAAAEPRRRPWWRLLLGRA